MVLPCAPAEIDRRDGLPGARGGPRLHRSVDRRGPRYRRARARGRHRLPRREAAARRALRPGARARASCGTRGWSGTTWPAAPCWSVRSVGKHLFTRFDDGRSLHSHFRMDGVLASLPTRDALAAARARGPRGAGDGRTRRRRVRAARPGAAARPAEESRLVGHLGPDLLDPAWDETHAAEALRRFTARRDAELGLVLLEQRVMAGVGNLYKTEMCFLLGLSPWTPVRDVADPAAAIALSPASCCCATPTALSSPRQGAGPRASALGVRARRATVLPMRHPDPDGRAGRRRLRARRVLVPALPARAGSGGLTPLTRRR